MLARLLLALLVVSAAEVESDTSGDVNAWKPGHYHHTWAVHIPNGDAHAESISQKHGFINHGQVSRVTLRARTLQDDSSSPGCFR